jgi:hypothetical protein
MMNRNLPLVIGDERIEKIIRKLNSKIHIFGHTHLDFDSFIDGVRYIQHPLAHPRERKFTFGNYSPKLIFQKDLIDST